MSSLPLKAPTTAQIRQWFVEYFVQKGHTLVPSSPLIPFNDATLLFTNAGMVQFKEVFLGADTRLYNRAVTVQRCVRAGGKHNDLDNVGYTARHHTFFEMLGNFSFGDYFKREAIFMAWEFLTQVLKLPREKLWVTVFEEDQEAEKIWIQEVGVDPARLSRIGAKDNFWSMGDTGPCGPCTEIFYDHGPEIPGGPPGSPEADGDRYIEIWNLVFMQYNRSQDGVLTPLPKPSVDTGMGLERLAAVLQHVHDNYHIDLFQALIRSTAHILKTGSLEERGLRVIADHIRATAFLIMDGVLPGNEGRGYVLRRIMRRAMRYGHQLGAQEPFFFKLVKPLTDQMGGAYPLLAECYHEIESVIRKEEIQFAKTLDLGLSMLKADLAGQSLDPASEAFTLSGEMIFKLYDTYGFPVDLTADIAREQGVTLDMEGFERCMQVQRDRARKASTFKTQDALLTQLDTQSTFVGYEVLSETSEVEALFQDDQPVATLGIGEKGSVVLSITPFYPESGGQVGDAGCLMFSSGQFEVLETRRYGQAIVHMGRVIVGELSVGVLVEARVDEVRRLATARNHSATHLLHAALRKILGQHVQQKGSLVAPDRLRFDFSHEGQLDHEAWRAIEALVNQEIQRNSLVDTRYSSLEEAKREGVMALFGEKYGDTVRVLSMGEFSKELCGGTHVHRTGDIGLFKLVLEGAVASGVRRIEAVTGDAAIEWMQQSEQICYAVAKTLQAERKTISQKLEQNFTKMKSLEKQLSQLQEKLASQQATQLLSKAVSIQKQDRLFQILVSEVTEIEPVMLKTMMDVLKNAVHSGVIVLGLIHEGRVHLMIGVTPDDVDLMHAGQLAAHLAPLLEGKGGGRPDSAQVGGPKIDGLSTALEAALIYCKSSLNRNG